MYIHHFIEMAAAKINIMEVVMEYFHKNQRIKLSKDEFQEPFPDSNLYWEHMDTLNIQ